MSTFVIILHVVVALLLTLVVLLQPGNKGGMGAAFGGAGGATVFGGRGANTFLAKLTAGAAVLFMVTSMSLAYLSSRTGSAFDRTTLPPLGPDVPVAGALADEPVGEPPPLDEPSAQPAAPVEAADDQPAAPAPADDEGEQAPPED